MASVLRGFGRISLIAIAGSGWNKGAALFGAVFALDMFAVWIGVQLIAWNKAFYDALEDMDASVAITQVGIFFGLTALSASSWLGSNWLKQSLSMHWRKRLTDRALAAWIDTRAYWHLREGYSPAPIDNPDQRVAEDCKLFIDKFLLLTLGLISALVSLFSFLAILWALSAFPLKLAVFGYAVEIPRYMVWAAFIYVAISSLLTHVMGKKLRGFYFRQERHEANFRHALIQMRERADQIARGRGEAAEQRRFARLFADIRQNWRGLIRQELLLGLFTRPYQQTVLRIPTFLALPAYFAGSVTLGGLMQLASAFSNVTTTLSWFIFRYRDLAECAAVTDRLQGLFAATASPAQMPDTPQELRRETSDQNITWQDLQLFTPKGQALAPLQNGHINAGDRVWICGPSGVGKSTFVAALSGLWPWGEGRISAPAGTWMVLPHGGCLSAEGLAQSLCYPHPVSQYSRAHMARVLTDVGLVNRIALLQDHGEKSLAGLSQGESQRVAVARALLQKPDVLVLDEATSALDSTTERMVLDSLRANLPRTTMLCISHRAPHSLDITKVLQLGGACTERDQAGERRPATGW